MAAANGTWGEERIAAELRVKLGIRVSPRTVRRYLPATTPRATQGLQAWVTFVRNHSRSVLACDFFVAVTATFRVVYVFVVLEIGTRRILHWNVTAHPTADWTAQQFRMIVPGDLPQRFVIHDRDRIYSEGVDGTLAAMGLTVLKTPVRAPQANAFCERLIGHNPPRVLGFHDSPDRAAPCAVLNEWVTHYNRGRPHASLGPGIPEGPLVDDTIVHASGHRVPSDYRIAATAILGGLHHEYRLEPKAA